MIKIAITNIPVEDITHETLIKFMKKIFEESCEDKLFKTSTETLNL